MTLALQTLSGFYLQKTAVFIILFTIFFRPCRSERFNTFVDPEQEKHECHISRGLRAKITSSDKKKKVNRQNEMLCETHSQ